MSKFFVEDSNLYLNFRKWCEAAQKVFKINAFVKDIKTL